MISVFCCNCCRKKFQTTWERHVECIQQSESDLLGCGKVRRRTKVQLSVSTCIFFGVMQTFGVRTLKRIHCRFTALTTKKSFVGFPSKSKQLKLCNFHGVDGHWLHFCLGEVTVCKFLRQTTQLIACAYFKSIRESFGLLLFGNYPKHIQDYFLWCLLICMPHDWRNKTICNISSCHCRA